MYLIIFKLFENIQPFWFKLYFPFCCHSIVSEDGASVYSASELAIAELPGLETSLRGAGNYFILISTQNNLNLAKQ
mgnify:CR=1 FL=1